MLLLLVPVAVLALEVEALPLLVVAVDYTVEKVTIMDNIPQDNRGAVAAPHKLKEVFLGIRLPQHKVPLA